MADNLPRLVALAARGKLMHGHMDNLFEAKMGEQLLVEAAPL